MSVNTVRERATGARWFPILGLIFVATLINYLNRTVFGIARPLFVTELHIDPVWAGIIASAFSWSYAVAQLPGGAFLDRFGTRITYALSLVTWSCFTLMQGFVSTISGMMAARLGLGLCEAPCFPANSRVLAHWFPQNERARATSIYSVGMYAGIAFLSVPLFWVTKHYGWRMLFALTGVAGIVFGMVFYLVYREPSESRLVNQAELDRIVSGGGISASKVEQMPFTWRQVLRLLSIRQVLCASICQFCSNAVLVFFLLDFVNYLATQRHMAWLKAGFFLSFPYMAAALGGLVGGQISDHLLKAGRGANLARKLPAAGGLVLAACVPLANLVPDGQDGLVILIMSIAFFGQGASNLGWTIISDIAPRQMVGVTAGIFNLVTNLAGILIPLVIGIILQVTQSYDWSLLFIGALPLLGAAIMVFMMGDIRRLEIA